MVLGTRSAPSPLACGLNRSENSGSKTIPQGGYFGHIAVLEGLMGQLCRLA